MGTDNFSTLMLTSALLVIVAACAPQAATLPPYPAPTLAETVASPDSPLTQDELQSIFSLSSKLPDTQLYFSDALGVGFTYLAWPEGPAVSVTESGNTISILDQTIEVFTKDPSLTLQQAIEQGFLQGYDPADCFVWLIDQTGQNQYGEISDFLALGYISAVISFPRPEGEYQPWWANADKCPADYSETNAVQYFLMNPAVPDKFLFVKVGQYSAASDGIPRDAEGLGFNWTRSIRILK